MLNFVVNLPVTDWLLTMFEQIDLERIVDKPLHILERLGMPPLWRQK